MPTMDVFRDDAFSVTSLSGVVDKIDYKPQLLGELGLFDDMPVRTRNIFVDRRDGKLELIPTSALGSAPEERGVDDRDAVPLKTTRLVKGSTIYAHEVDGIRATGTESETQAVQAEFLRRMAMVRDDMELTHEHHRLGALQGKLLDADGSTVIYDYFAQFDEAEPSAVSFELDVAGTEVRVECNQLVRSMARSARGAFTAGTTVHALAGDEFYDTLISHPKVKETYLNFSAAADLRNGTAFQAFTFGGITWHNYRGTDDNSAVAIPTVEAKVFPVGAREMFKKAMAPYEGIDFVNTLGQDVYALTIPDEKRQQWVRGEMYSYPLYICQQPRVLRSLTLT